MTDPSNRWLPEPRPPVSGHSRPQAEVGNTGVIYGTQQRAIWAPGQSEEREVCNALKPGALWRLSVFGRVTVRIGYGTQATRSIALVQAPVVLSIPGQFTAYAKPLNDQGAECQVTLTQATAGARAIARRFVTAALGAVDLDDDAVDFWALVASTLTISGQAVAVPALAIVPLVSGAVLNTGAGFQEFEA